MVTRVWRRAHPRFRVAKGECSMAGRIVGLILWALISTVVALIFLRLIGMI